MPRQTVITKKRGPAPTGKGELVGVRLQPDLIRALDAYLGSQGQHPPTRPDAIRLALRDWLTDHGFLKASQPAPDEIAAKIERLDAKAAALDVSGPASPQRAMNAMDKALTKGRAKGLRNKLAKAKGGKP